MKILVLNAGSSSLKVTLREMEGSPATPTAPLWEAQADWGREPGRARVRVWPAGKPTSDEQVAIDDAAAVFRPTIERLWNGPAAVITGQEEIAAVGHRIVHGGRDLQAPAIVTWSVREAIRRAGQFAPEHASVQLQAIEAAEAALGTGAPQIAVFDTGFHATMPLEVKTYPVPAEWFDRGVQRYGFHGISHRYTARRAAEMLGRDPAAGLRVITCHLGNGASLAAVHNGRSVDTTMGFTPLEGLMMGTRSGSVDPAILIYMMRQWGYTPDRLDRTLNEESGLKGISGISSDMREIVSAMEVGNGRAKLAFEMYVYRLVREIGGMAASLGGLEALVFTAGIGENSAIVRERACERLDFLGVRLDRNLNQASRMDSDVAAADSRVRVLIIHTEEAWEIARECQAILERGADTEETGRPGPA